MAILALGGASLLAGLDAALVALAVWAPVPAAHRGSGGICLAAGLHTLGQLLLIQGMVAFAAVYLALWRRALLPLVAVQVLSTLPALAAAALWLTVDLAGLATWVVAAAASALVWPDAGARLLDTVLVATAAWLARGDVARRMVRTTTGLRRFNGAALLLGYGWLVVAGLVWLVGGAPRGDAAHDVVAHTLFLGFGVSMVMAHAPIIFPAVLGRPLPYRPILWLPLVLLHGDLLIRVVGDVLGRGVLWQGGSVVTVVSLLLFVASAAWCVVRG